MNARKSLAACAAGAVLLAGCSGGDGSAGDEASPAPAITVLETVDPNFVVPDAVSSHGTDEASAYLVAARVSFDADDGTVTTDADGTVHTRDGSSTATFAGNDPRLTGTEEATWNTDRWGTGVDDGILTQWGTSVITTADGTWEGPYAGGFSSDEGDVITWWLTGHGAYEGWSMFMWGVTVPGDPHGVNHALIFPGDLPASLEVGAAAP